MNKIPASLRRDLVECHSYRKLAEKRGVNVYWISQLLTKGIEPTNPIIRVRLSLPAHRRTPAAKATQDKYRENLPDHLKWWRGLPKEERRLIVFMEYLRNLSTETHESWMKEAG